MYRNPYITPQSQNPSAAASSYSVSSDAGTPAYPSQQHAQYSSNQAPVQHRLAQQQQPSTGQLNMSNPVYPNHPPVAGMNANTHLNPNLSSSSYYPTATTRARANTINQMDTIPPALAPALARLQHMNQDVIGGRNALTPVLNRDDAMREWERRQSGKPIAAQPYPQLEYLQQQAEAAAASGLTNWASNSRYPPPPSKLSHSFHPPTITVDGENTRRDVVMSNVRNAARNDNTNPIYASGAMITSPTSQTYTGNSTTASNRYATTYPQTQQSGPAAFDSRPDMGNIYVPMQPDQYQSYAAARPPSNTRHVAPPAQAMAPSFYGAGIVPSGQTNNVQQPRPAFTVVDGAQPAAPAAAKDTRRASGLDAWPR